MTQHGITPEYRERIATALTELVDTTPPERSHPAAPPRRAVWITAAVAVALLPVLVIAVVAPLRQQTITAIGRSGLLPICSSELVAPFDCHNYLLTEGEPDLASSAIQNAVAWFEQAPDGQIRFTVEVNDRWIQVPVTRTTDTTATGNTITETFPLRDCTPDSDCSLQADLGNLFRQPTAFSLTNTGFTITDGDTTYTGTRTNTIHQPAVVETQRRNGRTLLIYTPVSDASNAAFNGGNLTTSDAGCITAGNAVLVLPDSARLNSDGTIAFNGRRLVPGKPANLGGGVGPIPANTPCGLKVDYWWASTR